MTQPAGNRTIRVSVVAASAGQCAGKLTWESATEVLRNRIERRFGASVSVEYIELFSPRSFEFPDVLTGIGEERLRLPVVLVGGAVVSSEAKLNEGLIARRVSEVLQAMEG